jgi:hypothetical protein
MTLTTSNQGYARRLQLQAEGKTKHTERGERIARLHTLVVEYKDALSDIEGCR